MTRSFHPPLYMALAASLLAFLLADVFTPRTAHSAMSINLCNHSGPDFEKIAARFKEELKPGEKIEPALKRLNLSPGLGDNRLRENFWYLLVWHDDARRIIEHEFSLFYGDKDFATPRNEALNAHRFMGLHG